jgi:hypothetical protein
MKNYSRVNNSIAAVTPRRAKSVKQTQPQAVVPPILLAMNLLYDFSNEASKELDRMYWTSKGKASNLKFFCDDFTLILAFNDRKGGNNGLK